MMTIIINVNPWNSTEVHTILQSNNKYNIFYVTYKEQNIRKLNCFDNSYYGENAPADYEPKILSSFYYIWDIILKQTTLSVLSLE